MPEIAQLYCFMEICNIAFFPAEPHPHQTSDKASEEKKKQNKSFTYYHHDGYKFGR